jgi:hypothetical protein
MTTLISAVVALLAAQPALAQQRESKPFNTVNGRTSTTAPAAPRVFTVTAPGGGASGNGPAAGQAPAVTSAMIAGAPSEGGRAYLGAGSQVPRAVTGRGVRRNGKSIMSKKSRRADGGGSAEEAPPNYSKPGALIRTTGQEPKYEPAPDKIFTHTTDAGEIVFNNRKGIDVGKAPTLQMGPKDTPPPPNPGYGQGYSNSGAAANGGPINVIAGGSTGGGHDNNGSGNNDKNKPGDTTDGQGGDKAKEAAFNDAF